MIKGEFIVSDIKHVLFLCKGNSARSIMAEAILNDLSMNKGRFKAHSAGSQPDGHVHPLAVEQLRNFHLPVEGLYSKSWEEFAAAEAPNLDFVIVVSEDISDGTCPVWKGEPMFAHWGVPDPAAVEGTEFERHAAFVEAFRQLRTRIELLVSLPFDTLDQQGLQGKLDAIGRG